MSSRIFCQLITVRCYEHSIASVRPGNVVLFHVPSENSGLELGLVTTIWKGVRNPKIVTSEIAINACWAFRAVVLDVEMDPAKVRVWMGLECSARMFMNVLDTWFQENSRLPQTSPKNPKEIQRKCRQTIF